jgi:hypothetical protein
LGLEADADFLGAGICAGEEAIVEASASAEAGAGSGESEAGYQEKVYGLRIDERTEGRIGLEEGPWAWAEGGGGVAVVEVEGVAADAGETEGFIWRREKGGEVGLGG